MLYEVITLGNPGRRYAETFHNAGFMAVALLAVSFGIRLKASGDVDRITSYNVCYTKLLRGAGDPLHRRTAHARGGREGGRSYNFV